LSSYLILSLTLLDVYGCSEKIKTKIEPWNWFILYFSYTLEAQTLLSGSTVIIGSTAPDCQFIGFSILVPPPGNIIWSHGETFHTPLYRFEEVFVFVKVIIPNLTIIVVVKSFEKLLIFLFR
jgi:hypothetical protein